LLAGARAVNLPVAAAQVGLLEELPEVLAAGVPARLNPTDLVLFARAGGAHVPRGGGGLRRAARGGATVAARAKAPREGRFSSGSRLCRVSSAAGLGQGEVE